MEEQATLYNFFDVDTKPLPDSEMFLSTPNEHLLVTDDFTTIRQQKKEKVTEEEEELTKSDEEEQALEQTLGENVLLGAELDLDELLRIGTLTLEDGCDRDETGYVKPTESAIEPSPWKPKNFNDVLGVKHFPAGTPVEEINQYEPPPHLVQCWQGAQDIFNKKWKKETQTDEVIEHRQARRAKARKDAKLRRKADAAAVKFEQENKN